MKRVFFIILLSASAWSRDEIWEEDYGIQSPPALEIYMESFYDSSFRWLYEKLLPEEIRYRFPDESFKTFRVHLKDSFQKFPKPENLKASNLKFIRQVKGRITYVGFIPKAYKYDVIKTSQGQILLNVRIHLKNGSEDDYKSFTEKTKQAEKLWNFSAPVTDFRYAFKFEIVKDPKQAHFSVWVLDETRGPYDSYWGRDWVSTTIAHEIGHMMGLGDEYQTLSGKFDCYRPSLMCAAWTGAPLKHHYYFILRRLIK